MTQYRGKSVAQLSALLQSGALDPVTLAEETFAAIEGYSDGSVFLTLTRDRAMAEAAAAFERIRGGQSRGVLDGVPIAWKDLFDIEGLATTAGSKVLTGAELETADAPVVAALAAAGMVSIGRVNMSEFAFSGLGINPHYGTPQNPAARDLPRLPGGSSSGSAVAVAAGLVPASIGTDTGGSVRIPAAFNGLVGYKASTGRYPMQGVFPLSQTLDSLGPLCHTVTDAVWLDAALRGLTAPQIARGSLSGLALVVPQTIVFDGAEEGVLTAFDAALSRLERAGARIERRSFPLFTELFELLARRGAIVNAEAFAIHHRRLKGEERSGMDPRVVQRVSLGETVSLPDYLELLDIRRRMIAAHQAEIAPGALIVSPTVPHVAPAIGPLVDDDDLFFATNAKTLRNTLIGNFFDWCALSLPCGTGEAGMPVGLQIAASHGEDERLLAAALAAEDVIRGR